MTASVVVSQFISNVPATILLASFTDDWQALAWGVSVGGFGLAIGSLANLIALRLARVEGLWREFHLWSLPALVLALGAAALAHYVAWCALETIVRPAFQHHSAKLRPG